MNYALGIPKGMRVVLEERGVRTKTLNGEQMRTILSQHNPLAARPVFGPFHSPKTLFWLLLGRATH